MNVLRYHRLRFNLTPKRWLSTADRGKLSERLLNRLASSESEVISSSGEALGRRQVASSNLLDTLNLAVTDQKHSQKVQEQQKQRNKKRKEKQKQRKLARNNEPTSAPSKIVTRTESIDPIADLVRPLDQPSTQDAAESSDELIESPINYNDRDGAPHIPRTLLYTRRVEGVLHSLTGPILQDLEPPSPQQPIAQLAHGLDRVLFNPGVSWLQDPRSNVYNYTTWLENVPSVKDFAFERLGGFISSSRDQDLWSLARSEKRTFAGSTSSLSGLLSHIYFLISGDKRVNTTSLSRHFQFEPTNFTPGQRMPASVVLKHSDGVYAIDSLSLIPGSSEKNVLTWMGTVLEKFLTMPKERFSQLLRSSPDPAEEPETKREAYRYSKSDKFVMRSQLDCYDPRLPGTGVFDIKTRAAVPIRLDLMNYEENSGYIIRTLQGPLESFEKEYYDLIRSAFLKYSFQARIGNMDGVLVAYHNTARIFGFQYVPLSEMDSCIFGNEGRGDRVFEKCVQMMEAIMTEAVHQFPDQSLRCVTEKKEGNDVLQVFLEPADWNEETQGPTPIVQLDVTVVNYAGDTEVRGSTAVARSDLPWTILYSISTPSLSQREIRGNLSEVISRQFFAYNLPSGVSVQDMEERWNEMNFNPSSTTPPAVYDPAFFKDAGRNVLALRALARAGRDELEERDEEWRRSGRKKIVLEPGEMTIAKLQEADTQNVSASELLFGPELAALLQPLTGETLDKVMPTLESQAKTDDDKGEDADFSNDDPRTLDGHDADAIPVSSSSVRQSQPSSLPKASRLADGTAWSSMARPRLSRGEPKAPAVDPDTLLLLESLVAQDDMVQSSDSSDPGSLADSDSTLSPPPSSSPSPDDDARDAPSDDSAPSSPPEPSTPVSHSS